jgi:hypothetical protein
MRPAGMPTAGLSAEGEKPRTPNSPGGEKHARRGRNTAVMNHLPQREAWRTGQTPPSSPPPSSSVAAASPSLRSSGFSGPRAGSYQSSAASSSQNALSRNDRNTVYADSYTETPNMRALTSSSASASALQTPLSDRVGHSSVSHTPAHATSSAVSDAGQSESTASTHADNYGAEAVEAIKQSRIAQLTAGGGAGGMGVGGTIEEDFVFVPGGAVGSSGYGTGYGTPSRIGGSAGTAVRHNISGFDPHQNFTIVATSSEEEEILDEDGLPLLPEEKELYLLARAKERGISKSASKSGSGSMGGLTIGGASSSSGSASGSRNLNNDVIVVGGMDQDMQDVNDRGWSGSVISNSRENSHSPPINRKNRSPAKVSRETIIQNYEQMFHEVMANQETIKRYEQGFEKLQFLAAQESYAVLHRPDEEKGNAAVLAEAEAEAKRLE